MLQGSAWFLTKIIMQRLMGAQWPGDLRGLIRRFRVLSGPYRFLKIILFIYCGCAESLLQASNYGSRTSHGFLLLQSVGSWAHWLL